MRKTTFVIEDLREAIFDGFINDNECWNGWACPYFTFEESLKIVEKHIISGNKAGFDEIADAFWFEIQNEKEFYESMKVNNQKVYPIGNFSWIWEEKL